MGACPFTWPPLPADNAGYLLDVAADGMKQAFGIQASSANLPSFTPGNGVGVSMELDVDPSGVRRMGLALGASISPKSAERALGCSAHVPVGAAWEAGAGRRKQTSCARLCQFHRCGLGTGLYVAPGGRHYRHN